MTLMEVYLASTALLALIIGLANFRHSCKKHEVDMVAAQAAHKMAEALVSHANAIRELHQIALRQDQRLADQETKIMGAMSQGKDLANLRNESRQAAEILLEKIREHERKLDALAVAMLKSGN